jgi:hypothetical protein
MSWDVVIVSDICPFIADDEVDCNLEADIGKIGECNEKNCPIKHTEVSEHGP